jgi:hypothetical protein
MSVAWQEIYFQRYFAIISLETARYVRALNSTIANYRGMRCLGGTCIFAKQYDLEVTAREVEMDLTTAEAEASNFLWLSEDAVARNFDHIMHGPMILIPQVYNIIMRMLGGPPQENYARMAGADHQGFIDFGRRVYDHNITPLWGVRMQMCNERMRRQSALPIPIQRQEIDDHSRPIPISHWTDWAREHKRRIRRVVFLMRLERSMKLLFEVLRMFSAHLKVQKSQRTPRNPAYSGGQDSHNLPITMGLGITSRMLRDFPVEIATAKNELRYSRMMVRQHHILLPYQPLLERVWFVRPHIRALAAVEDAMASHRGPPSHKPPPPGQRRTPPSRPPSSLLGRLYGECRPPPSPSAAVQPQRRAED